MGPKKLLLLVSEHTLEFSLVAWGVLSGGRVLAGDPPSTSLATLPMALQTAWALVMIIASVSVTLSVFIRRRELTAVSMYLFSTILAFYAVVLFATLGFAEAGLISGFLITMSVACSLRGWWHREIVKETQRGDEENASARNPE